MIKLLSTTGRNNTSMVWLESSITGLNSNRDWSFSNCVFKSIYVINWDISVRCNWTYSLGGWIFAMAFSHCVWVISSRLKWICHRIRKCVVHETTLASTTVCITVNKLLLGKWNSSWIVFDSVSWSNATSCRKSPATTTVTLVLNWNNSTSSDPINFSSCWCSST